MKHKSEKMVDYVKHFDYIGALLYTAGLLLFILGLSWGGNVHPWKSAAVLATLLVGVALLAAFVLWEIYAPLREPLVPMRLFKNGPWIVSTVVLGVGAGIYYAFAIIWYVFEPRPNAGPALTLQAYYGSCFVCRWRPDVWWVARKSRWSRTTGRRKYWWTACYSPW